MVHIDKAPATSWSRLRGVLGQLARDGDEELVHVGRCLGAGLHKEDAVIVSVGLGLLKCWQRAEVATEESNARLWMCVLRE